MPRREKVVRRVPAPDARYNSELVARFINKIMERMRTGAHLKSYNDDVAVIHLNGPRPAVSEQADDGWYLRLADGEVVARARVLPGGRVDASLNAVLRFRLEGRWERSSSRASLRTRPREL